LKNTLKYLLQKLLGFDNYLFVFSLFKISTLSFDKKESDFLHFLKLIKSDGLILDIGANIGIMSVLMAKKLNRCQIIAFEPISHNIKALKRVLSHYNLNNTAVVECALGNQNGNVEMVMPVEGQVKMQGLSHVVGDHNLGNSNAEKFVVPINRLDDIDIIKSSNTPIVAIKIDVENHEYFVLEGCKQLLAQHRPIVYVELWDNENRGKCFDLFKDLGYTVNVFLNGEPVIYDPAKHVKQNFLLLPKKLNQA